MDYTRISTICEEKRMSIPELAKKIGFSRQGLIKAITGGSMRIDTIELIAKALNVSVSELIDDIHFLKLKTEILNLKERVSNLNETTNEWSARVDQLEKENTRLQTTLEEKSNMLLHYSIIVKQYEKKLFPEADNSNNP